MQRSIVAFQRDDEGHWVAVLDCAHGQHVRHTPPFVNRPWTRTEAGRNAHLGASLDCLKCERLELPEGLEHYRSTHEFDERSLPAGLRRTHATKRGVWGRIRLLAGCIRYTVSAPFQRCVTLSAPAQAVIAPEVSHAVEPLGAVRLVVDFLRRPAQPGSDP